MLPIFTRRIIAGVGTLIVCCAAMQAQPQVGLYGAANLNRHNAALRSGTGTPTSSSESTKGTGTGFTAGALYGLPLSSRFFLELRLGYSSQDGMLKRTVPIQMIENGEIVNGAVEQTLDARLGSFGIEPMIGYRVFGGATLRLGARAGIVLSPTYTEKETLVQPAAATFPETGTRVRGEYTGDIPQASAFTASLLGGVGYDIPVNAERTFIISPEAFYAFGLTPVADGFTWNVHTVRLGLAVKYALSSYESMDDTGVR